ncbi:intermembrane transport protein PqiB [Pseudoroseomonas cervicalis]|uniref:PqiB family protein n=1 Tax=Teichococcus cervicalis TaxID=204525 RepID=UPI002786F47E|nr:MlaD family protein [Pseudoroseomonas cervicalis]MDQ1077888.1 paraquat-inducible protein B [Pseudoroseomonas cervicalis]
MPEIEPEIVEAQPRRRHFSWIWLIPLAAAAIAIYLGYSTYNTRGPLVTIRFASADGLSAGQTQVRYKSVTVGTVEAIRLTGELDGVDVSVRMTRDIADRLTEPARFWVVRPRLSAGNLSGIETIVSGAYIEFDPGPREAERRDEFRGLDDPPGVRAGEPGRVVTLRAPRLGALSQGSPVFFRDVPVGEVLAYDPPALDGPTNLRIFIRAPYDGYLRGGSRFWNTSGANLSFGGDGVKLEIESLQAVLAGGIAFDTPREEHDKPVAPPETTYFLFESAEAARTATSPDRLEFLVYLEGSVRGLSPGAPVELRGIRIGSVTRVELAYDRDTERFRVPVRIAIEPSRIAFPAGRPQLEVMAMAQHLVDQGMRFVLRSGNLLTGQKVLSAEMVPEAPPVRLHVEGEMIVLPSSGGDGDDIMAAVSAVAGKLERFPLDEIGRNLNGALAAVNGVASSPALRQSLENLAGALAGVEELVRKADGGLTPLLRRLPEIANNLDQTVRSARSAIASIERGYGGDSQVNRQIDRTLQQLSDTARSVRLLADFLERHPEALIRGRRE